MARTISDDLSSGDLVVVDTNVLRNTNLLMSPVALSLLFYLERAEVFLGIHEVVESEWREQFIATFTEKLGDAARLEGWLNQVAGISQSLPSSNPAARAQRAFSKRLEEISGVTETIAIRSDHWAAAGQMVLSKQRPSTKSSQQFKDSLIWRGLLHEGRQRRVVFVTQDKGFTNTEGDLEETLAAEAAKVGAQVDVVAGLTDVLDMLGWIKLDVADRIGASVEALKIEFKRFVDDELDAEDLFAGRERYWKVRYFVAPDPGQVTAVVSAEYELKRSDDPDLWEDIAFVEVEGVASIESPDRIITIELDSLKTVLLNPHQDVTTWIIGGEKRTTKTYFRGVPLNLPGESIR